MTHAEDLIKLEKQITNSKQQQFDFFSTPRIDGILERNVIVMLNAMDGTATTMGKPCPRLCLDRSTHGMTSPTHTCMILNLCDHSP